MRQLGEAIGVGEMTVWRWEKERVAPRRKMLPLLANVLGIELRDLFYYYFS
jgi:transcriptional regulator with XRE-family HTH domain